jgi:predicted transcriptional regulator of viral defense system
MDEALLKRFEQNGGYFRTAADLSRPQKYQLQLLMRKGIISRVKRGLYRMNSIPGAYQEIEASHIVPSGIFCMYTAWAHYGLTTHVAPEYHMAVLKSLRIRVPDYPPIKLYFWNASTFDLGLSVININGAQVRMYDLERSVCDAVKFRNKTVADLLGEIMRNYVSRKDKNIDTLLKYAAILRISNTLNQLLQVIL